MMAYTGRVCSKRVPFSSLRAGGGAAARKLTFFRLQLYERIGISLVEVYKKGREICRLGL